MRCGFNPHEIFSVNAITIFTLKRQNANKKGDKEKRCKALI